MKIEKIIHSVVLQGVYRRKDLTPQQQKDTTKSDKVEISREAKQLQKVRSSLKAPDIRPKEVDRVKKRIEKGYYDQEKVIEKIAEEILQSGQLDDLISKRAKLKKLATLLKGSEDIREGKIKIAKQRIKEGFYFTDEVYSKIADKIIEIILREDGQEDISGR